MTAAPAERSSQTHVGIMLPMKNVSRGVSAGSACSEAGMCERAAFAHTAPSPTSPASATIRRRSVASTTGGRSPVRAAPVRNSPTKRRMSASGLPVGTPSQALVGAWLTPMPKRKRPPLISWMKAAVCAKSYACRV